MKSRICLEVESDPTLHKTSVKKKKNKNWLVVYLPLWKIVSSVGIIIPNIWKSKIHVPNHQKKYRNLTPITTVPSLHVLARIGGIGHQHIILWKWGLDPAGRLVNLLNKKWRKLVILEINWIIQLLLFILLEIKPKQNLQTVSWIIFKASSGCC